jgi:antitoxin component YwqK of YwqJK toxin-antitoxin module
MAKDAEPTGYVEQYANGRLKMRGSHLDGEMHGSWEWFRADGSVMRTGQFDRGRQIGAWRTFDRTGRMVKETDFGPA